MITLAEVRMVNKQIRADDESHLFPIRGKFNVAERAIRQARKERKTNECYDDIAYLALLDSKISKIVNDERNW